MTGEFRSPWISRRRTLAAIGALAAAIVSDNARPAGVHKCTDAAGVTYQDRPCGSESASPGIDDAPLSVMPSPGRGSTLVRREDPVKPVRPERTRRTEAPRPGNAAERRHLRTGMSEGEVLSRLGPPDLTSGKGRRLVRWTWLPVPGDPDTLTVVLFDTGRIVEIERTIVRR